MAARPVWSGAITFGGFPIHVRAYSLLKSASADSFKGLCPCHHSPIEQHKHCAVTGETIAYDAIVKGATQGRGKAATYHPLSQEVIDAIGAGAGERSAALEILRLPPANTVPWTLATGRYRIVPDDDVAGSEGPVEILWNGLMASERALISQWSKRTGSKPVLMAMRADIYGLTAIDMPYASDLNVVPEHQFTPNDQAQAMFEQFVTVQGYNTDEFAHTAFADEYAERRADLIAQAIAGQKIEVAQPTAAQAAVPDLMAAMQAALSSAQPPAKAKKGGKAKAKVAA